jgi:hypothetical protein
MADPSSISFDFVHLDHALKRQWPQFDSLRRDMAAFEPRPVAEFEKDREELLAHFQRLNPDSDTDSLAVLANNLIEQRAREDVQFSDRFSEPLMTVHVTVALLSHSLCEALINALIAVGLVQKDAQELFPIMERAEIKEKWRAAPKVFAPEYKLDSSSALFHTLRHLTKRRNVLVHHKVDLHVGEHRVLKGSDWEKLSFEELGSWTERYFALPYDLSEHALAAQGVSAFPFLTSRAPIPRVRVHDERSPKGR